MLCFLIASLGHRLEIFWQVFYRYSSGVCDHKQSSRIRVYEVFTGWTSSATPYSTVKPPPSEDQNCFSDSGKDIFR